MSRENRLKQLGLWNLRDNPEELDKELDKLIEQKNIRARKFHEERNNELVKLVKDKYNIIDPEEIKKFLLDKKIRDIEAYEKMYNFKTKF